MLAAGHGGYPHVVHAFLTRTLTHVCKVDVAFGQRAILQGHPQLRGLLFAVMEQDMEPLLRHFREW